MGSQVSLVVKDMDHDGGTRLVKAPVGGVHSCLRVSGELSISVRSYRGL